jgi:hypothetical protein
LISVPQSKSLSKTLIWEQKQALIRALFPVPSKGVEISLKGDQSINDRELSTFADNREGRSWFVALIVFW